MTTPHDPAADDDHFGPDCPQCRAQVYACEVIAGFAESLDKLLRDGTFERIGAEVAVRREEAVSKALGVPLPPAAPGR